MTTSSHAVPLLILRVLAALGIVAAVGVAGVGAVAIIEDERESTDMWDGLGTFLGLLAIGGAAVALFVLGALLFLLTRRPRAGLQGVAILASLGLVGGVLFLLGPMLGDPSFVPWDLAAAYGAGCLAVLGLAAWGLATS